MLSPINISIAPPGGWSVTVEGAGPEIRENNFQAWLHAVGLRLRANNLDTHNWRIWVVDLMCRQRPDIQSEDDEVPPSRAATGDDAKRWIRTMWEAWKGGAVAVSEEEQDRRADICLSCPKRGVINCFGGCGAIAGAVAEMVMGSGARRKNELFKQNCMVCGCELASLVIYPLDVLQRVDEKSDFKSGEYDPRCWKIHPENDSSLSAQPEPSDSAQSG